MTNTVAKRPASMIELAKKELPTIISAHVSNANVDVKRIVAGVVHLITTNPDLQQCSWQSLVNAIVTSLRAGLDCTGYWGEGWILPYRRKDGTVIANFIPGYKGFIKLALTGNVQMLEARVVYANDVFEIDYGSEKIVTHKPVIVGDRGPIIGAYALAWIKGSSRPLFEFMTTEDIEKIRARSRAKDSGPWVTDWPEMARKTVVRRIVKYCNLSDIAKQVIEEADRAEFDFDSDDFQQERELTESQKKVKELREKLKEMKEESKAQQQTQEQNEIEVEVEQSVNSEELYQSYWNGLEQVEKEHLAEIVQQIMSDNALTPDQKNSLRERAKVLYSSKK
jgi:recombination protein RecT